MYSTTVIEQFEVAIYMAGAGAVAGAAAPKYGPEPKIKYIINNTVIFYYTHTCSLHCFFRFDVGSTSFEEKKRSPSEGNSL